MTNPSDLSGSLKFIGLGDLLQLLGSNGSTGELRLMSPYAHGPGIVYLVDGNPVDATAPSSKGLDALLSLFGWIDGAFEFVAGPVSNTKVIKKNRMEIILDGLAMLDDGQIQKLGPTTIEEVAAVTDKETGVQVVKGPLVDYMYVVEEEEFSDGAKIVIEGKHGNWIWVILSGIVEVIKESPKGPVSVIHVGDGGFIGSMSSFTLHGGLRSATALAKGNVQLGVLDSQRLATEYSRIPPDLRNVIMGIDKRMKQLTKRVTEIIIDSYEFDEFIEDMKPLEQQEEEAERIFMIEKGEVTIVRENDYGNVALVVLGKGDFIGPVPFINIGHEPHSARIYATDDLELRALDITQMKSDYEELSTTFKNIVKHLANCLSVSTRLACTTLKKKNK